MIENAEGFARFDVAYRATEDELLEAFTAQRWGVRLSVALVAVIAAARVLSATRGPTVVAVVAVSGALLGLALPRVDRALVLRTQKWQLEDTRFWGEGESTHVVRFSARFDRAWGEWKRLRVMKRVLVLEGTGDLVLVIPTRAFRDEDAMGRFIEIASRNVEIR